MLRHLPLALALVIAPAALAQIPEPPTVEVLSPHWVALRFSPQYPHGRHTQNPLPTEGLQLPVPEASQIRNQAGQTSDTHNSDAEYRIPVPDFAADAGVDRAFFNGILETTGNPASPALDGVASLQENCPQEICSQLPSGYNRLGFSATVPGSANPAEFTIGFSVKPGQTLTLRGGRDFHAHSGPMFLAPTLFLHTREPIAMPTGFHTQEQSGLAMPTLTPLFDQFLRDTSIIAAPDGNYYMTGTTGGPEMMVVTSDLSVWKSPDLVHWSPVRDLPRQTTVVWNLDRDGSPWLKAITLRDGEPFRPLWAPEIHYINHTFWIPFSVPRHGITILKSTTGKAEGPYEIAIKPDEPLSTGIDASLFQDDDGTVYSLYGGGWIARMKPDMSGLAEPYRHITSASGREAGFEGVYLFKDHGRYYLTCADFVLGEYNTYVISATSLNGPWSERYLAVPHAGHANFFRDKDGRMWSTFFGNDRHSPYNAKPGIVPMMQDAKGRWRPDASYVRPQKTIAADTTVQAPGAIGPSNGDPQHVGIMPAKP
jgi:xylan 1,4-beta-xylosidase